MSQLVAPIPARVGPLAGVRRAQGVSRKSANPVATDHNRLHEAASLPCRVTVDGLRDKWSTRSTCVLVDGVYVCMLESLGGIEGFRAEPAGPDDDVVDLFEEPVGGGWGRT